jgi:hypothetical protein
MDPISATLIMLSELLKFMSKVVDGQTPEQKKIIWDWFIEDQQKWRKFLKMDQ